MSAPYPPIWLEDGRLELWHPDSPGVRVRIQPGRLRRWGWRRSEFATLGEVLDAYRARGYDVPGLWVGAWRELRERRSGS